MKSELSDFTPYLLNQAAEAASREFQPHYKERYGMLRTEWRVLFHIGCHGEMTAKEICEQASIHKTKVSRAVSALDKKRFVQRKTVETDRRSETLILTSLGQEVFANLSSIAAQFDDALAAKLGAEDIVLLKSLLTRLISK